MQHGKSSAWCGQHQLVSSALVAADALLSTVFSAMAHCKLSDVGLDSSSSQDARSEAIMQSLTTGFFQQTATGSPGQLFVTSDYLTNPTRAVVHNRSTLAGKSTGSSSMVLFFNQSMLADGRHVLAGVGHIQPDWVVTAAAFDPQLASMYVATIHATDRGSKPFVVSITSFPTHVSFHQSYTIAPLKNYKTMRC